MSEQPIATPDAKADASYAAFQQACKELGARLATCRRAAGLSRRQFADRIGRSPATIGRAETGQRLPGVDFWRAADHHLHTGGVLAAASLPVAELRRAAEAQSAASVAVHQAAERCLSPQDCLCRVAVAHWTQAEIRALRIALRHGFGEWAMLLQTGLEVALGWESPRGPLPNLAEQRQFDELLTEVSLSVRARFRLLVAAGDDGPRPGRTTPPPARPLAREAA